ncbi:MAG: alpha/beta fold hydrolase [Gammaproteobacteria bacterium]|nr:alpha/beta fold hydrolase [Gammaproteobacteria bacterium]
MPRAPSTHDVEIEYTTYGAETGPALLLVGGLGVQIPSWSETLVEALVSRGFRVIAYDNRDCGLSTAFDDWGPADIGAAFKQARAGEAVSAPYKLEDMADDGAAVLDHLGIDAAHIVGSSNGGAIAQIFAYRHAGKTASLVSIMATSGRRGLPRPSEKASAWLGQPRNPAGTREGAMQDALASAAIIGSPGFPRDEKAITDKAARLYDRAFNPAGSSRHLLASIASGDGRAQHLGSIRAPTLVIHGREDPLVPVGAAQDVADSIPNTDMLVIAGMAHDYPDAVCDRIASAIAANATRSAAAQR